MGELNPASRVSQTCGVFLWITIAHAVALSCLSAASAQTTVINLPPGPIGGSISAGTQLNVLDGGQVPDAFTAFAGSEVRVLGGTVGAQFTADDSKVFISQGSIGADFTATAAQLTMTGGTIQGPLIAQAGSVLDMAGGELWYVGSFDDSTLNLSGGLISGISGLKNSTVNMTGGEVQNYFYAESNDVVNVSGGNLNVARLGGGSVLNATGGTVGPITTLAGASVNIRGGRHADGLFGAAGSTVTLFGDDFRIDGVLVAGLSDDGASVGVNVTKIAVLSGALTDGTPFSMLLTPGFGDNYSHVDDGVLRLQKTSTPAAAPAIINLPTDPVPTGVRAGQTLVVDAGGSTPAQFNAGWGSAVEIRPGASIADGFEAVNAAVTITGGTIGRDFNALVGSVVTVTGGAFGDDFLAFGSTLNASGGAFGTVSLSKSTAQISGNFRGSIFASDQSTVTMTEGVVENESALAGGSQWDLSGGVIGDRFTTINATPQDRFDIRGSDFRINGAPVAGLASPGDSAPITLPREFVFTGTLADGTPFAFSDLDGDRFGDATVVATVAAAASPGQPVIDAAVDPVPAGIRAGQTLRVANAAVGDHFNAGRGSAVDLEDGGSIGRNFEAAGAAVVIRGGSIEDDGDVFDASDVEFSGGTIGRSFNVSGSTFRMTGGVAGEGFRVGEGAQFDMSGGKLLGGSGVYKAVATITGGTIGPGFGASTDARINFLGGSVDSHFEAQAGGTIHLRGGNVGDEFVARDGSVVHIYGSEFRVDGQLVAGLENPGSSVTLAQKCCAPISAVLSDGTPFNQLTGLNRPDFFSAGSTIIFYATETAPIGPALIRAGIDPVPLGIRAGQTLIVGEGADIGPNFQAGWGSVVTIEDGGIVGANLEAIGAVVNISGGTVGPYLDIAYGELNISGGFVDHHGKSFAGSVVNISGGYVSGFYDAAYGSIVNITGGTVEGVFNVLDNSVLNVKGGLVDFGRFEAFQTAALNLFGRDFALNGVPITGLTRDVAKLIPDRNVILSGILTDGSSFSVKLGTNRNFFDPYFAGGTTVSITLAVPEPANCLSAVIGLIGVAAWRRGGGGGAVRLADSRAPAYADVQPPRDPARVLWYTVAARPWGRFQLRC